ncbi:MAG TPA: alpha/beta fold hydrolase [Candidatus Sulfotelmatobacter sp.]|nr:alpha/beta fold hydrolase [Candidatus Sulfotelmatobacter sp.]
MTRALIGALGLILALLAVGPARAQSPAEGSQRFAELGDLQLRSGSVIHDFRLGYRTLGKLNADKSNAVLWPTWLGGRTEDLLGFVGPGKVVDSGRYFVVLVDSIGNGVTSSPSNSRTQRWMKFPEFTIRDMVEAERRLATDTLHLTHFKAVMGVSMGGMQAFEWAVAYPDFMDVAIPMAGSPQSTSYDKLQWTAMIDAVELDPAWNNGNPTGSMKRGLEVLQEIASMNLTSPEYRVQETPPEQFEAFLAETRRDADGDGGTASDAIRQRQAIMALDIPGEFGISMEQAAKRVRAKMLVIVSPQDHHVNPIPAEKFAQAIGAPVILLDSPCGHLAFTCISVGPIVAQFLADPASVRSMTLHDTVHSSADKR